MTIQIPPTTAGVCGTAGLRLNEMEGILRIDVYSIYIVYIFLIMICAHCHNKSEEANIVSFLLEAEH